MGKVFNWIYIMMRWWTNQSHTSGRIPSDRNFSDDLVTRKFAPFTRLCPLRIVLEKFQSISFTENWQNLPICHECQFIDERNLCSNWNIKLKIIKQFKKIVDLITVCQGEGQIWSVPMLATCSYKQWNSNGKISNRYLSQFYLYFISIGKIINWNSESCTRNLLNCTSFWVHWTIWKRFHTRWLLTSLPCSKIENKNQSVEYIIRIGNGQPFIFN